MTATYVNLRLDLSGGDGSEAFGTEPEDVDCIMMARVFDVARNYEPSGDTR